MDEEKKPTHTVHHYHPHEYLDLIESLGHTVFTQDQELLKLHVQNIYNSTALPAEIQRYTELVLSTRERIQDDLELDNKLVVAASNALSILHYGSLCGLFDFQFTQVRDFSQCRIPHANFNLAFLNGCVFDHADLSHASFLHTTAYGTSFRHAKLGNATDYSRYPSMTSVSTPRDTIPRDRHARTPSPGSPDTSDLRFLAVVPNEFKFLTLGKDAIQLWDASTMSQILNLDLSALRIRANSTVYCHMSNDGHRLLVAGAGSREAGLWDLTTGDLITKLGPHKGDSLEAVALSPDGQRAATSSQVDGIYAWDLSDPAQPKRLWQATLRHCQVPLIMRFSPDRELFAVQVENCQTQIRDAVTGRILTEWRSPDCELGLEFSSDGEYIAVSGDKTVSLWETKTWKMEDGDTFKRLLTYEEIKRDLEDETSVLGICQSKGIPVWKLFGSFQTEKIVSNHSIEAMFPDQEHYIPGAWQVPTVSSFAIRVWYAKLREDLTKPRLKELIESRGYFHTLTLSPDGRYCAALLLSARSSTAYGQPSVGKVVVFDCTSGQRISEFKVQDPSNVVRLEISSDRRYVMCMASTHLTVFDMASSEATSCDVLFDNASMDYPPDLAFASFYNHDPTQLVCVMLTEDNPVKIFDVAKQEVVREIQLSAGSAIEWNVLAYSSTTNYLAGITWEGVLRVYDLADGKEFFSPQVICGPDEHKASVRNLLEICFSPDGRQLACADDMGRIQIVNTNDGKITASTPGHTRRVQSIVWSECGKCIITAGPDSLRFWDPKTGALLHSSLAPGPVAALALSADGRTLISLEQQTTTFLQWTLEAQVSGSEASEEDTLFAPPTLVRIQGISQQTCFAGADIEGADINPTFACAFALRR